VGCLILDNLDIIKKRKGSYPHEIPLNPCIYIYTFHKIISKPYLYSMYQACYGELPWLHPTGPYRAQGPRLLLLLAAGADPTITSSQGRSAMDFAQEMSVLGQKEDDLTAIVTIFVRENGDTI